VDGTVVNYQPSDGNTQRLRATTSRDERDDDKPLSRRLLPLSSPRPRRRPPIHTQLQRLSRRRGVLEPPRQRSHHGNLTPARNNARVQQRHLPRATSPVTTPVSPPWQGGAGSTTVTRVDTAWFQRLKLQHDSLMKRSQFQLAPLQRGGGSERVTCAQISNGGRRQDRRAPSRHSEGRRP